MLHGIAPIVVMQYSVIIVCRILTKNGNIRMKYLLLHHLCVSILEYCTNIDKKYFAISVQIFSNVKTFFLKHGRLIANIYKAMAIFL